eukprot:gb/GEZN01002778.1/.p1 GENE.gb/GEZN01002778.1/~~gb/GEZN01002778.1/.p1  ORF type:complete len:560 (-),score=107.09 gb/GEZN01002778.1/:637-2316(-)
MGSDQSKPKDDKKTIAIVGGGYAGAALAKKLDASGLFHVVLIDRKKYFLHNIGILRTMTTEGWEDMVVIPYSKLLKQGSVLTAEVTQIDNDGIHIFGRDEAFKADITVIATGSSYAFPAKVAETQVEEAMKRFKDGRKYAKEAKRIVIIGGGAVGCELAGELATDFKDKDITLIHSRKQLVHERFMSEFHTKVSSVLQSQGVKLILEERVLPIGGDSQDFTKVVEGLLQEGRDALLRETYKQSDPEGPPSRNLLDMLARATGGRYQDLDAVEPSDLPDVPVATAKKICQDLQGVVALAKKTPVAGEKKKEAVTQEGAEGKKEEAVSTREGTNPAIAMREEKRARKLANKPANYAIGPINVITNKGTVLEKVDLVFFCMGTKVNNKSVSAFEQESGRLLVNDYLQVKKAGASKFEENIYALGDIAERNFKMAFFAGQQASYLAGALINKESKKNVLPCNVVNANACILSLGRNSGVSQLPIGNGKVFGGFFTRKLKSADLFAAVNWKLLNQVPKNPLFALKASPEKQLNLQKALALTEADARKLATEGAEVPDVTERDVT